MTAKMNVFFNSKHNKKEWNIYKELNRKTVTNLKDYCSVTSNTKAEMINKSKPVKHIYKLDKLDNSYISCAGWIKEDWIALFTE